MNDKLAQIRFYANNDPRNTHSFSQLSNENIEDNNQGFTDKIKLSAYNQITDFNIRTLPGTLIYFYKDISTNDYFSIRIDHSGVYNLTCTNISLQYFVIDKNSLDIIEKTDGAFFIATISHT